MNNGADGYFKAIDRMRWGTGMATKKTPAKKAAVAPPPAQKKICGIIMPISAIASYPESHWSEIRNILSDSITKAGFEPNLVSDADDAGLIHKRIIQNLYDNEIVVCDVSAKNPNVMFELGLRLAFDKATIIVKDDKTEYSFDTAGIEHLEYPHDLRFAKMVEFQNKLTEKVLATHNKATTDATYTTFLKHFGDFTTVKIDSKEVPAEEFLLDELRAIKSDIRGIKSNFNRNDELANRTKDEIVMHYRVSSSILNKALELVRRDYRYSIDMKQVGQYTYRVHLDGTDAEYFTHILDEKIREVQRSRSRGNRRISVS